MKKVNCLLAFIMVLCHLDFEPALNQTGTKDESEGRGCLHGINPRPSPLALAPAW